MVKDAPGIRHVLPDLLHFIGDCRTLVAHNAMFDLKFIGNELKRYGGTLDCTYICTLSLARQSFPELTNHKLPTVAAHLGLTGNWHTAIDDARVTGQVALHCISLSEVFFREEYTPEELASIDVVKRILTAHGRRLDSITCTRWQTYVSLRYAEYDFLRIKLSGRIRCVLPCKGLDGIEELAGGLITEKAPMSANAAARVLIEGVDDLPKLEPLILACYQCAGTTYDFNARYIRSEREVVI